MASEKIRTVPIGGGSNSSERSGCGKNNNFCSKDSKQTDDKNGEHQSAKYHGSAKSSLPAVIDNVPDSQKAVFVSASLDSFLSNEPVVTSRNNELITNSPSNLLSLSHLKPASKVNLRASNVNSSVTERSRKNKRLLQKKPKTLAEKRRLLKEQEASVRKTSRKQQKLPRKELSNKKFNEHIETVITSVINNCNENLVSPTNKVGKRRGCASRNRTLRKVARENEENEVEKRAIELRKESTKNEVKSAIVPRKVRREDEENEVDDSAIVVPEISLSNEFILDNETCIEPNKNYIVPLRNRVYFDLFAPYLKEKKVLVEKDSPSLLKKVGMVLYLGVGRALYQEQFENLSMLRKDDCVIDKDFVKFATSTVVDRKKENVTRCVMTPVVSTKLLTLKVNHEAYVEKATEFLQNRYIKKKVKGCNKKNSEIKELANSNEINSNDNTLRKPTFTKRNKRNLHEDSSTNPEVPKKKQRLKGNLDQTEVDTAVASQAITGNRKRARKLPKKLEDAVILTNAYNFKENAVTTEVTSAHTSESDLKSAKKRRKTRKVDSFVSGTNNDLPPRVVQPESPDSNDSLYDPNWRISSTFNDKHKDNYYTTGTRVISRVTNSQFSCSSSQNEFSIRLSSCIHLKTPLVKIRKAEFQNDMEVYCMYHQVKCCSCLTTRIVRKSSRFNCITTGCDNDKEYVASSGVIKPDGTSCINAEDQSIAQEDTIGENSELKILNVMSLRPEEYANQMDESCYSEETASSSSSCASTAIDEADTNNEPLMSQSIFESTLKDVSTKKYKFFCIKLTHAMDELLYLSDNTWKFPGYITESLNRNKPLSYWRLVKMVVESRNKNMCVFHKLENPNYDSNSFDNLPFGVYFYLTNVIYVGPFALEEYHHLCAMKFVDKHPLTIGNRTLKTVVPFVHPGYTNRYNNNSCIVSYWWIVMNDILTRGTRIWLAILSTQSALCLKPTVVQKKKRLRKVLKSVECNPVLYTNFKQVPYIKNQYNVYNNSLSLSTTIIEEDKPNNMLVDPITSKRSYGNNSSILPLPTSSSGNGSLNVLTTKQSSELFLEVYVPKSASTSTTVTAGQDQTPENTYFGQNGVSSLHLKSNVVQNIQKQPVQKTNVEDQNPPVKRFVVTDMNCYDINSCYDINGVNRPLLSVLKSKDMKSVSTPIGLQTNEVISLLNSGQSAIGGKAINCNTVETTGTSSAIVDNTLSVKRPINLKHKANAKESIPSLSSEKDIAADSQTINLNAVPIINNALTVKRTINLMPNAKMKEAIPSLSSENDIAADSQTINLNAAPTQLCSSATVVENTSNVKGAANLTPNLTASNNSIINIKLLNKGKVIQGRDPKIIPPNFGFNIVPRGNVLRANPVNTGVVGKPVFVQINKPLNTLGQETPIGDSNVRLVKGTPLDPRVQLVSANKINTGTSNMPSSKMSNEIRPNEGSTVNSAKKSEINDCQIMLMDNKIVTLDANNIPSNHLATLFPVQVVKSIETFTGYMPVNLIKISDTHIKSTSLTGTADVALPINPSQLLAVNNVENVTLQSVVPSETTSTNVLTVENVVLQPDELSEPTSTNALTVEPDELSETTSTNALTVEKVDLQPEEPSETTSTNALTVENVDLQPEEPSETTSTNALTVENVDLQPEEPSETTSTNALTVENVDLQPEEPSETTSVNNAPNVSLLPEASSETISITNELTVKNVTLHAKPTKITCTESEKCDAETVQRPVKPTESSITKTVHNVTVSVDPTEICTVANVQTVRNVKLPAIREITSTESNKCNTETVKTQNSSHATAVVNVTFHKASTEMSCAVNTQMVENKKSDNETVQRSVRTTEYSAAESVQNVTLPVESTELSSVTNTQTVKNNTLLEKLTEINSIKIEDCVTETVQRRVEPTENSSDVITGQDVTLHAEPTESIVTATRPVRNVNRRSSKQNTKNLSLPVSSPSVVPYLSTTFQGYNATPQVIVDDVVSRSVASQKKNVAAAPTSSSNGADRLQNSVGVSKPLEGTLVSSQNTSPLDISLVSKETFESFGINFVDDW